MPVPLSLKMIEKILLALIGIGISTAQVCPPQEVLYPCTCTESGERNYIDCVWIDESFDLKEVFDNASDFVNDDVIFDELYISQTSLSEIGEGAIQHLKFRGVLISYNSKLTYISPLAFNASSNITTDLLLWGNPIGNESPHEKDFFDFVRNFKNLQLLQMIVSDISSVPDGAFENMTSLRYIDLSLNNISRLGSRAFSNTPRLTYLLVDGNLLPPEGAAGNAFDGIGSLAEVDLSCNKIDFMEQTRFQPLLDQAAKVTVGVADYCHASEYGRLYCDERADWICDIEERYRGKLSGFNCKQENGYNWDIWQYCSVRNSTIHAR